MSFRTSSLLCVVVAVAAICATLAAGDMKLPAAVKTCKRDSPDYSSCLRLAIQESWPIFVQGLPEFDLPPLDPFVADYFDNNYEDGEIRGHITAKGVQTYGLSKTKFLAVRPTKDGNSFRLEIDVEMPKVFIDGNYIVNGTLGTFKIGGSGYFNISLEELRGTWDIEGILENDRWVVEHFRTAPEVGKMKVYFSDLFNGNQEMNQAALAFVNEYWPTIYRGMLPYLVDVWDKHLTDLANRVFSKVSFAEVFP